MPFLATQLLPVDRFGRIALALVMLGSFVGLSDIRFHRGSAGAV
jgi:hypothetical protein